MGILQVHVNLKLNGAPQTSLHPDQVPELWGHSADGFFTVFKQHLVQVASFWLTGGEREMKSKRHLAMELRLGRPTRSIFTIRWFSPISGTLSSTP